MTDALRSPGYSSTPLVKKLGIKPGMTMLTFSAPREYAAWLGPLPDGAALATKPARGAPTFAAHMFVTKRAEMAKHLAALRKTLAQDGFVWVSWPKKASKIETDITEDTIRDVCLPMGFVDIKVCAVSEVWSGLKLVIRKSERR